MLQDELTSDVSGVMRELLDFLFSFLLRIVRLFNDY